MIKGRFVTLGFVCLTLFALCVGVGIGFRCWLLCIPGVAFLIAYFWIDKKFLRCPRCGGFLNTEPLSMARRREFHCIHCGEQIKIQ